MPLQQVLRKLTLHVIKTEYQRTRNPKITGIRLGTPAATTRGFKEKEFETVGNLILETLSGLKQNPNDNSKVEK